MPLTFDFSLEKLAGLEVERVFPGHGPVFTDYREAVERSKKRIARYLDDPQTVGADLFKRIIVYTLLMHDGAGEARFFDQLMGTIWFPENVEFYADGEYETVYRETMEALVKQGAVARADGRWVATVDP